jgi:hypothetical protein
MDPITIILAALVAGTAKAAGDAVPDAYKGLKALIQKKLAGKPVAEVMLEEHEKDPETYAAPLKKNLVEAGVAEDEEILKAAQELLKQAESEAPTTTKYQTEFQAEVKAAQIGDQNKQENKFA